MIRPSGPRGQVWHNMLLTDILHPSCIKVPLEAQDKQGAIHELSEVLARSGAISDVEAFKEAVWRREQTRTTGIGHGIAIPHGKVAGCDRLVMAAGICKPAIDFGAIDRQPVDLIFLLGSPLDQTGPHIQALATISRMLTDVELRDRVRRCQSSEELYQIMAERDASHSAKA